MKEMQKPSALIIGDRATRRFFSGVDIGEGTLVVAEEKTYFADKRYFLALKDKLKGTDISVVPMESPLDIKAFLEKRDVKTIGIDYSTATVEEYERFKSFGFTVENARPYIDEVRAVKNKTEIANIKKACEIIEKAYYKTLPYIVEGVSEVEIKDRLEKECFLLGAEKMSFDTIVAFGQNSAVPHHETGTDRLKKNSAVLIDAGVFYKGYASDLTRTAFYGKPTEEFIKVYNAVLTANELAESTIKAGTTVRAADKIARDYIEKTGYGDKFTHSLGHGVGLEIHEFPYISQKCDYSLKDGNVFTVEPGIYLNYNFGVRIEDTVYLDGGKLIRFFTDDKKLVIL